MPVTAEDAVARPRGRLLGDEEEEPVATPKTLLVTPRTKLVGDGKHPDGGRGRGRGGGGNGWAEEMALAFS